MDEGGQFGKGWGMCRPGRHGRLREVEDGCRGAGEVASVAKQGDDGMKMRRGPAGVDFDFDADGQRRGCGEVLGVTQMSYRTVCAA